MKDFIELLEGEPDDAEVRIEAYFNPQMFVGLKAAVSVDGDLIGKPIRLDLAVEGDDDHQYQPSALRN